MATVDVIVAHRHSRVLILPEVFLQLGLLAVGFAEGNIKVGQCQCRPGQNLRVLGCLAQNSLDHLVSFSDSDQPVVVGLVVQTEA